jgi:type II secretory ATPase GspE/PulE/Tfp pilus assembly ATPase PilB-like protein
MTGFFQKNIRDLSAEVVGTDFRAGLSHKIALCSSDEARKVLPVETALQLRVLPLRFSEHAGTQFLHALVPVDFDFSKTKEIEFQTGMPVRLYQVEPEVLDDALLTAYYTEPLPLSRSIDRLDTRYTEHSQNKGEEFLIQDNSPAFFLQRLFDHAIGLGASDIHLVPAAEGVLISVRRYGQLLKHQQTIGNKELARALTTRICVLCGLDFTRLQKSVEGSLRHRIGSRIVPIRVSMLPCFYGTKIAFRIPVGSRRLTLHELGLKREIIKVIEKLAQQGAGLLLFSGTTGSGKTTSSYAFLEAMAARNSNVYSLEDPVEQELSGVTQIEIARHEEGLNFQQAFKALMRQDPDVIHVGEIRDQSLAKLSIEAALSGHLVSGTIHAHSVAAAKRRLEILAGQEGLGAYVNGCIVHQRLRYDGEMGNVSLESELGYF